MTASYHRSTIILNVKKWLHIFSICNQNFRILNTKKITKYLTRSLLQVNPVSTQIYLYLNVFKSKLFRQMCNVHPGDRAEPLSKQTYYHLSIKTQWLLIFWLVEQISISPRSSIAVEKKNCRCWYLTRVRTNEGGLSLCWANYAFKTFHEIQNVELFVKLLLKFCHFNTVSANFIDTFIM